MLQKLSKCEVKAARYGNFTFCLPLRFLALLKVLNLNFSTFELFLKSENSKLNVSEIGKMAIFDIEILSRFISQKVEWQRNNCIVDVNFTF